MPPTSPYATIKDRIASLAASLYNIPDSPVWIHEKQVHQLLSLPSGPSFGPLNCLSLLLKGMEDGYWGNKKKGDSVQTDLPLADFEESSTYRISIQTHGRQEQFPAGTLDNRETSSKPRWFQFGSALTDIDTQKEIVNKLIGEHNTLSKEVSQRRKNNYTNFYQHKKQDAGYANFDVPHIAYEYRDIWGQDITAPNEEFINLETGVIQRRAFEPDDLSRIEFYLRMMLAASNKSQGKLNLAGDRLVPHMSTREARGTATLPTPLPQPASSTTNTPRVLETPATQPSTTRKNLWPSTSSTVSSSNIPRSLLLKNLECTIEEEEEEYLVNFKKVDELASLEYALYLYCEEDLAVDAIKRKLQRFDINLPTSLDLNELTTLSDGGLKNARFNIKRAREKLEKALDGKFVLKDNEFLYEWNRDGKAYTKGRRLEVDNFVLNPQNRQRELSLSAAFILRHIMFSFNFSLQNVLMLWACFNVLILRRELDLSDFPTQTTLWNHVHRLDRIDNKLRTDQFSSWIVQRSPNGFRRYFYSSSDDSEHFKRNRHVVLISHHDGTDTINIEPSFRHVTSSVSAVKSENATMNGDFIIDMLGLSIAACYGGGTNDNAGDAQKEIRTTFYNIMSTIEKVNNDMAKAKEVFGLNFEDAESLEKHIHSIVYENGVKRRPIVFGDPFHIANLCVTWASVFAFGETENADHSQIHHRQLMMSIHSLHTADRDFSQAVMDELMANAVKAVKITSKAERSQRWLVNQRNAKKVLEMLEKTTQDGIPSLVAWGLHFANKSRSNWKRRVGKEIATWSSMPAIKLGLHFESELGGYFEEIYAWHNRTGPINKRSGFRMMEMFDLYFGFEIPWWNEAVNNPQEKLPRTMKYLEDNFQGEEYNLRKAQIMRGLNKGRDELIKMSTKYLLQAPIVFLCLCHHQMAPSLLRAMLTVLHENPIDEDVDCLIHDADSQKWGVYKYDSDTTVRPPSEKKWYDILSKQPKDVVHWWRQFGLNKECLIDDLQRLSSQINVTPSSGPPLKRFQSKYPILFECLHSVFGLMMSNSRLCEQVHGMMRHGLRASIGMEQADAQRSYATSTDHEMKQERQAMSNDNREKRRKGIDHDKTKLQQQKLSSQLLDKLGSWLGKAMALLERPDHGIPTVTAIKKAGRRVQDKNLLEKQVEAEKAKTANLTRDELTVDMINEAASRTELSNDKLMKMGEDRLQLRLKIVEIYVQKFWKEIAIPAGVPAHRHIMKIAWKSFPYLHMMVFRNKGATCSQLVTILREHTYDTSTIIKPISTKTELFKNIGSYLSKVKATSKLINEFMYGENGSSNRAPKRDRLIEISDLLAIFKFIRIVDTAWEGNEDTCQPEELTL